MTVPFPPTFNHAFCLYHISNGGAILIVMTAQKHKSRLAANFNIKLLSPLPITTASTVLGIGLGGFVDGFFLHQIQFDFWRDKAAFYFLTTEDKIYKYVSIAEDAIKKDGYLILVRFSENGPKKCSGLEIR